MLDFAALPTAVGRFFLALVLAFVATLPATATEPTDGDEPPAVISDFFGHFEGRSRFPMGEKRNRELEVTISPYGAIGFTVDWSTISQTGDETEHKAHSLTFLPGAAPGLYVSQPAASNPTRLVGTPVAWAKHDDKTLTVHVLTIVDSGDYVVQSYARTLTRGGIMNLEFQRVRSGVVERSIKGTLKRIDEDAAPAEDASTP